MLLSTPAPVLLLDLVSRCGSTSFSVLNSGSPSTHIFHAHHAHCALDAVCAYPGSVQMVEWIQRASINRG
eukprot:11638845-Heterocapsa_arctica.AAC.1